MSEPIHHLIEPFDIPCCPLCDNEIRDFEQSAVVNAYGAQFLVHVDCLEAAKTEINDERINAG